MAKKLTKYNQKRNFTKTKEPIGKEVKTQKKLHFVIQHHIARKDHYDLRLEWNGVLKSWAVPKGPSYNPKDKRLAIQVEDHPLSYRNFEGTIPKGEYGGGTVMIWDEGYWEPLKNEKISFKNKPIKFILKGQRLKGKWTLIPLKEENWLLIKEKEEIMYKDIQKYQTSIRTGKTMEEIEKKEKIKLTNPGKIIVSYPKITKKDIFDYYQKVAKRMLPYIEKRIISTICCPEGMQGSCFYKKHFTNSKLKKILLSATSDKKKDYYYIDSITGLLSEVQMNSYEFHIWGSTVPKYNKPNLMIFDLDPDEKVSLKTLRKGVKDLKQILDSLHLDSYLKTSGGKGYHIVVPLEMKTWKSFSKFAENVANLMEEKWPEKYTSNIRKKNRQNKIFIDWIRNTKGATSVAPYSIRMRKNLPVSMPIFWNELDKIKPNEITMREAIKRTKRKDPWKKLLDFL